MQTQAVALAYNPDIVFEKAQSCRLIIKGGTATATQDKIPLPFGSFAVENTTWDVYPDREVAAVFDILTDYAIVSGTQVVAQI
jgi:hypothetical protein